MKRALLIATVVSILVAGCASGSTRGSTPPVRGPVNVLYAASLLNLMERDVGPAFTRATGYRFSGFAAGSSELASEIKSGVRQGDVFISASPIVNDTLRGESNGNWLSWAAVFAKSPLVLGFNPHSRFAQQLRTQPWERVVTEYGFLLGRTDPAVDPKGSLTVKAIEQTASLDHDPVLLGLLDHQEGVFPEETLVGRLQAGQLDAGFFYANEAKVAAIPTVPLTPATAAATFTVTVLERSRHPGGAGSFVKFLLGASGRHTLVNGGLDLVVPSLVTGTGVPVELRSVLHHR